MMPLVLYKEMRRLEKYIGIRKDNKGDRYLMGEILIYKKQIEQNPQKYFRWLMCESEITRIENLEMKRDGLRISVECYNDIFFPEDIEKIKRLPYVDWRDKL